MDGGCGGTVHGRMAARARSDERVSIAWRFTAIQSGFQLFSLFQDGAIQILEV
jgi:hypothetical protein